MKEKIISRTIESTKATVLFFNAEDKKMFPVENVFSGKLSKEDILKIARKEETETIKAVFVESVESDSKLYGMKESDFISKAVVLDDRTAKLDGEKLITRSIENTKVSYLAFNVSTMTMETKQQFFSGKVDKTTALKELRSMETETVKIVDVSNLESYSKLYAVKESVFLEYAYELPPRMNSEKEEEA